MTETNQTPLAETSYWSELVPMAELIGETLDWATRNPDVAGPRLDAIERELPSGSGIDNGTKIDRDAQEPTRAFTLYASWHAMDSNGYYAGWFDFSVIVESTFSGPGVSIAWRDGKSPEEDYACECSKEEEDYACDCEWVGISDPTDYLIDTYHDAVRETRARIEFDTPPEPAGRSAGAPAEIL